MFVAALMALAMPATAQKNDPVDPKDCYGEPLEINGKKVCFVITNPDDYYRVVDKPKERIPHLKLAGSLMVNSMMTTQFDDNRYNYMGRTGKYGWPRMDSSTSLERARLGWGLAAQWSPDGIWWVEASWQRPERVTVAIVTERVSGEFLWRCDAGNRNCPGRAVAQQKNEHSFTADDFSLGMLYDVTKNDPSCSYFSLLVGGGITRRYLSDRHRFDASSGDRYFDPNGELAMIGNRNDTFSEGTTKAAKTRIYGQLDLELYPAGKNRWVGLVLSTRVLSDGDQEQQFFTSTLNDSDIVLGIQPDWYDVTARIVLRF